MKIVFLDTATVGQDVSLELFRDFGALELHEVTTAEQVVDRCQEAEVVITNKVKILKEHIERLPKLKLICLAATGMDNIDLKACAQKGVEVKNVAGYSTHSVAQISLAMVLNLKSRLEEQNKFGKNNWFNDKIFTNLDSPFAELYGKTWGIIGLGAIGTQVARVASALGCEVVYYSSSGVDRSKEYRRVELEELLGCDVISVHCPLNERTQNLINESNTSYLKESAILVNVARGGVVSERAIVDRFKESKLSLGFDVASVEPIEKENPLLEIADSPRLILTPHIAWSSLEARSRLIKGIYNNIKGYLQAHP